MSVGAPLNGTLKACLQATRRRNNLAALLENLNQPPTVIVEHPLGLIPWLLS